MLSPLVEEEEEGGSDGGGPSPLPLLAHSRVSVVQHSTYLPTLLHRSRVACEELSGLAYTRLARLSFGDALQQGLGKLGQSRVSLVQAHVTHMDTPPPGVLPQPLLTLHLSRNALRTLVGVQPAMLHALTALSLAHNCIDDVTIFAYLGAACPGLTDLRLEGNPVCSLLDARAHAAAALPFLRTFDGKEVTAPERRAAVAKVSPLHCPHCVRLSPPAGPNCLVTPFPHNPPPGPPRGGVFRDHGGHRGHDAGSGGCGRAEAAARGSPPRGASQRGWW
jgi:hypothetical protein